jgi:hypothetical protein
MQPKGLLLVLLFIIPGILSLFLGPLFLVGSLLFTIVGYVLYKYSGILPDEVVNGNVYEKIAQDDASASCIELKSTMSAGSAVTFQSISWKNTLTFMINGNQVTLVNPDPAESLSSFIRDRAGFKGTKLGCEEVI